MPKISVLVPIYNVEQYLRECLYSLVSQTLTDIEIICINDGSTDSSLEIIEEYAQQDSRIKIIDKPNSGYGASMNLGISAATGEYIGIVEPDDFVKHEMYSKLYEIAKKNDADVVKSDYYENHTKINIIKKAGLISSKVADQVINIYSYPELVRIQPSLWTAIYKRAFLAKNNILFLETPGASYQDTSFTFKAMAMAERVVLTPKAYVYYRMDNENSSVNSTSKVYMVNQEFDEISKFLDSNTDIKKQINTEKLIKQHITYMWNLTRIDKNFEKEYIDVFSKTFKEYYVLKEIKKEFFKKIDKKDFFLLINNPEQFYKNLDKVLRSEQNRLNRRKKFSLRIRTSGVSAILFGKQIIGNQKNE